MKMQVDKDPVRDPKNEWVFMHLNLHIGKSPSKVRLKCDSQVRDRWLYSQKCDSSGRDKYDSEVRDKYDSKVRLKCDS